MRNTRIMIVDDHAVVRRGVGSLLANEPDLEICGEASNGRLAVEGAMRWKPDMVIMDVVMPELNGLEATRQILKNRPETQILILTGHESEQLVRDVFASGARGYVLKSDVADYFMTAVRSLKQNQLFFSSKVAELVMRGYLDGARSEVYADPACKLSPREREIVQLLAEGNASKEVAALLGISLKTVETHRAHIMSKLGLHSIADLVRYAIRNNMALN